MRLRWKSSLLALALTAVTLGQTGTPLQNPQVRRLGEQLACLCGCGSSVTSCNMLQCHFSEPARDKLLAMVTAGNSDSDIMASFVKENGTRVLLKPPAEGFNLVGWVMPFVALAIGLAVVWWWMQRSQRPMPAGAPGLDLETMSRYQERIEKDLAKLD
jgi:cytochrome c-type biogenesis protein CcmH